VFAQEAVDAFQLARKHLPDGSAELSTTLRNLGIALRKAVRVFGRGLARYACRGG
jgi:hypothetical protein